MQAEKDITFGKFRLDFTNECLWHDALSISLRPKAFAVLKLLIENPGQLVSKQKVLETVWPNTFVGDAVLKDNIRQLREALNDDAMSPTYIETAHRRGYRFIAQSPNISVSVSAKYSPALPAPETTLLGREAELQTMQRWMERAFSGQRQTVFVTGEPGIGKTSIVNAFLENARRTPELLVARGQCLEQYGSGEAYLPVLDAVSRLCRAAGGNRVVEILRQYAPAWLAQISSLLPQSERETLQRQAAGSTRERMLREMAEAIEALTSESPLLLVLEDLHWSDYSTLDLISYLARRHDPARLMIIGTYRPVDVILDDHPLKGVKRELQAHGLCQELALEYLSQKAINEFIFRRFPVHEFPSRLGRAIYQRTEGNPLFLVNLVEYLIDQKIVVFDQETWKLRVELAEVEEGVPANLRQLIEKQIERLNPDERAVLEAATVAGMECSTVAIAAALGKPLEWIEQHCDELARRHHLLSPAWMVQLPDGTITPRYRFVHILYRDVPYRLMAPMRRSQMHQRIAERGIAIYGNRNGEIAAELAMHFEQSRDWPRALQYLIHAAENATRKSAHHEAADLAQRGLVILKLLPESAERDQQEISLRMILITSLMAVKGFAGAGVEEAYAGGKELFRFSKPSPQLFNWLYLLGLFYMFRGNTGHALEIADRVLDIAGQLKDPRLLMEAHRAKGGTLLEMGRAPEAFQHVQRSLELHSANQPFANAPISGRDCKVLIECSSGKALWALGQPDAALHRMQAGLEFARHIAHPQSLAYAAHFAAQLHQLRGEPLLAQERAQELLRVAEEYCLELWVAVGKIDLGWADAELGEAAHGIEQMQQGLTDYTATRTRILYSAFLGSLADQLNKAHRFDEGLEVIAQALSCASQTGEAYTLAELHRLKGELLLNSNAWLRAGKLPRDSSATAVVTEAQACFSSAMTIAKQQGAKSFELRAAVSMHRLDLMLEKPDDAHLAKIYSSFTEGFETADLRQANSLLVANQLA